LVEAVLRLPAASCATPAEIEAITVPALRTEVNASELQLGPALIVTVLVPPAVPPIVTPAPVKPLTGSLNTAVKLIGEALVGSAWPAVGRAACRGGVVSGGVALTLLTELVEAVVRATGGSVATLDERRGIT